jgi:hypothetical protein
MYATRTPLVGRTMTLGDLLQSLAHDRLPPRFLALLPLLLLPALGLLLAGWWRTATPLLALGFFGAWGWTDVWLDRVDLDRSRGRTVLARAARGAAALCGVLSAGALIVVLLTRVLGAGVSCLGCAG